MTSLRYKIAKWLVPEVFREMDFLKRDVEFWEERSSDWSVKAMRRGSILLDISKQRTPGRNATVRRICDMADVEVNRS